MENERNKKVLITGVSGFIASHLAERCIKEDVFVRGVCRKPQEVSYLKEAGVEIVKGDLLNIKEIESAVNGCNIVVHAAGWSGNADVPTDLAWRTNVQGTINVVEAARKSKVERLIYISSVAVYGLNNAPVLHEGMETPKVGELYPDSKIEAEKIIRNSNIPYVIIRPGSIYGPRGKGWTLGVLEQIKNGELLLGNGEGKITPGYIDNFIDGLWLAMNEEKAVAETFNLCDADSMTYTEFYLEYARMLNIKSLPTIPAWRIALAKSQLGVVIRKILGRTKVGIWSNHFRFNPSQYSIEHAISVLGYEPKIDFREGMQLTERWLKENLYISQ